MAKLFAQPTEQSPVLSEVAGKSPLRALEQSEDKQWVFVSDGLRYGWIRKSFVTSYDERLAAVNEKSNYKTTREKVVSKDLSSRKRDSLDDDLSEDDDLDESGIKKKSSSDFDEFEETSKGQVFFVRNSGSLYDKPLRNADRFASVESNDQVEFLNLSTDQKWARVRVLETGEEGWIQRKEIARKRDRSEFESLNRLSDRNVHWSAYGVFSPVPWSLGFIGTLSKTLDFLMIAETPLEFGLGFGYNFGSTYTQALTVSYWDARGFMRWEPKIRPKVALPFEFGFLYKYAIIRTLLTKADFDAIGSRVKQGESGLLFGIGASYLPNDVVKFVVLPELQVTSSIDLVLNAGVTFSF
jgi:hypothetical protein